MTGIRKLVFAPGDRVRYCDNPIEDYYVVNVTPSGNTVITYPPTSRMNPECFELVARAVYMTPERIEALEEVMTLVSDDRVTEWCPHWVTVREMLAEAKGEPCP